MGYSVQPQVSRARLVLGIDLTASNEWQGRATFRSTHPSNTIYIFVSKCTLAPTVSGQRCGSCTTHTCVLDRLLTIRAT